MPVPSIICRGKNLHLATMKQFLAALPRKAMPKADFFEYAEKRMVGFRQTHSQIARQMALYYCDSKGICYPRFHSDLSLEDIFSYSRYWAEHYFVPNPYTPSFPQSCSPTNIYAYVIENCKAHKGDLKAILYSIFNQELNEVDKARSYLLQFTDIIEDSSGNLLCDGLNVDKKKININPQDEVEYFHYFDAWAPVYDFSEKFLQWCVNVGGKSEKTATNYLAYLACLNKEPSDPINNHSTWPGIYPYLFNGHKSQREVCQVGTLAEFQELFGPFCKIFDASGCPSGASEEAYNACVKWVNDVSEWACLSSAFKAYRSFLVWRNTKDESESQSKDAADDILDVAIEVFKRERGRWSGEDGLGYQNVNVGVRTFFGDRSNWNIAKLVEQDAFRDFCIKHTWMLTSGRGWAQLSKAPEKFKDIALWIDRNIVKSEDPLSDSVVKDNNFSGFTNNAVSELLMKFHPDKYCLFNSSSLRALKHLKLNNGITKERIKDKAAYAKIMDVCENIRKRLVAAQIYATIEGREEADFITVNEFIRFVDEKWDLIEEEYETVNPLPGYVDLLTVALKEFNKVREESDEHTKSSDFARKWFADYTPQKLIDDFAVFRKNFLWSRRVQNNVGPDYEHVQQLADLIGELKKDPRQISYYLSDEFGEKLASCPGIGHKTVLDMLMKLYPVDYCAYNGEMHMALVALRLLPRNTPFRFDANSYRRAMGLYEEIRQRMIELGIHMTNNGNTDKPDMLTVNAFLWFVKENIDSIKEEVMSKKMKEVKADVIKEKGKNLDLKPGDNEDMLKLRLLASLRAKPFVILAGHSGTGKSRIVRKLAYMTCNVKELQNENEGPQNFCMVQVKPNWHDSADLLGYRSAINDNEYVGTKLIKFIFRAYAYPNTPFFLCLDEMNLAPVEQYFAEFLSAMESLKPTDEKDTEGAGEFTSDPVIDLNAEQDTNLYELGCEWTKAYDWFKSHGFTIPKNLFVVGTVNMDETTCQFSRKVLDRAMTIEMTEASFADYGKVEEPKYEDRLDEEIIKKLITRPLRIKTLDEDDAKGETALIQVQKSLEKTPFAVAFRFANEYMLYKRAIKAFDPEGKMKVDPLDHIVLMKVLPRISGEKGYVANIFTGHEDFKTSSAATSESLLGILKDPVQISNIKMNEILARKGSYLTFWP